MCRKADGGVFANLTVEDNLDGVLGAESGAIHHTAHLRTVSAQVDAERRMNKGRQLVWREQEMLVEDRARPKLLNPKVPDS